MIEITAADFRRACALIVHHTRRNTDGCNAVLEEVNETDRIAQLIFGILDLYEKLIPILHTEVGVTVLNQLILDMSAREESDTMTLKPCLICGEPSDRTRCPEHTPIDTKTSARKRGYSTGWDKLSKRARRLQPWCETCGSVEDLTTDHSAEAWAAHAAGKPIKLDMIAVLCRPCNSRKGAAR